MKNKKVFFGFIGIIIIVFISGCYSPISCPIRDTYESIEYANITISSKEEAFSALKNTLIQRGYGQAYYENQSPDNFEYKEVNTNLWNGTDYIFNKTYLWVLPGIGIDSKGNIYREVGCA